MTTAGYSRSRWLGSLLLVIVASRIPLLLSCYSSDADAWRVAHVGKIFWQTGVYSVSRFPGYPLHEILGGVFVLLGGSLLSNAATLVVSLLLIAVWYRFGEVHTSSAKLLTLLLAFNPLYWIDSAATLDYVWSLLFVVLALTAVQRYKTLLAGMWLGCAIGCRPTNVVAALPLLALLYFNKLPRRAILRFIIAAFASTLVAFSPVLFTYGLTGWMQRTLKETSDAHLPFVQRILSFAYRSVYGMGPLAVIAIVTVLVSGRRALTEFLHKREPLIVASVVGVGAFVVLFAVFPLDRSYMLPSLPFLFLIVERIASRRALITVACCAVSFAFINPDVVRHQRPSGLPGFNIHAGIVIEEWQSRNQLMRERDLIANLPIDGKAVVMVGISDLYFLENANVEADSSDRWKRSNDYVVRSRRNPDLHFVSGLPLEAVRTLEADGYVLYCMDWTTEKLRQWYGYIAEEEGIKIIRL